MKVLTHLCAIGRRIKRWKGRRWAWAGGQGPHCTVRDYTRGPLTSFVSGMGGESVACSLQGRLPATLSEETIKERSRLCTHEFHHTHTLTHTRARARARIHTCAHAQRERERERETDRQTDRQIDRQRQREREKDRDRQR